MKTRLLRIATSASVIAIVVQALGAGAKWSMPTGLF